MKPLTNLQTQDAGDARPWRENPDTIRTWPVARTNVQLHNQLIGQGRSLAELTLVHNAYLLAMRLYAGKYGSDLAPFITHPVGVASIMAAEGYATEFVVTALIHNVYSNADWGDARTPGNWPSRRAQVAEHVGEDVERLLTRFGQLRIRPDSFPALLADANTMSSTDRALLAIELADYWEKYCELAASYYGVERWDIVLAEERRADLVRLAELLGHAALGELLDQAIAAAATRETPQALLGDTRWSKQTVAPSLMVRPKVRLIAGLRQLRRTVRMAVRPQRS